MQPFGSVAGDLIGSIYIALEPSEPWLLVRPAGFLLLEGGGS